MSEPETQNEPAVSGERRVEVVRAGLEAYNAGDIEGMLATCAEDIEIYGPRDFLNAGTFHGHEGFLEWISAWNDAWESFDIEIEAIKPVGEDHVVAEVQQTARGRGSGIEIELRVAYVWEFRDGLCSFLAVFQEADQAYAIAREREAAPSD